MQALLARLRAAAHAHLCLLDVDVLCATPLARLHALAAPDLTVARRALHSLLARTHRRATAAPTRRRCSHDATGGSGDVVRRAYETLAGRGRKAAPVADLAANLCELSMAWTRFSHDEVRAAIDELDADGDGVVTLAEFEVGSACCVFFYHMMWHGVSITLTLTATRTCVLSARTWRERTGDLSPRDDET